MELTAILGRLERVEKALNDHEVRLASLERAGRVQPASLAEQLNVRRPVEAPPVQRQPVPLQEVFQPLPEQKPTPRVESDPTPKPPKRSINAEYQIGARILPYAGATLFILGLAYLVSLGVGRGYITPAMLWWGVNLLSLAFVGVGQAKRDEREQFGQILTAIGSCGFYLNFAAGHVFQHLYDGETLVALFVGHSLVNLGYAFWRSSRAFLALGLFGGLLAALMPLSEQKYAVHVALQFLILAPATLIAARNKWIDASMWIYAAGTATMIPVAVDVRAPNELRVAAILGTGVLTVAGYAWSHRKLILDPYSLFAPLALFLNGLIGFLCFRNEAGAGAMVVYGAAIAASSWFAKDKAIRDRVLLAAVAIPATLAPFGFEATTAIWIFFGLAAAFVIASRRIAAASILATAELVLAMTTYLLVAGDIHWAEEAAILVAGGAVIALVTWGLTKAYRHSETLVLGASMLGVPLLARLAKVVLALPTVGFSVGASITVGLLAAAAGAAVLAAITRWDSAKNLLSTTYVLAYTMLALVVLGNPPAATTEIMLLSGFLAVLAIAARLEKESLIPAAASLAVPIVMRLVQVLLTSLAGWTVLEGVALGLAVSTAALCVLIAKRRTPTTITLGWGVYLLGYTTAIMVSGSKPLFTIELILLASYLALAALLAKVAGAKIGDRSAVASFAAGVPIVAWTSHVLLNTWPAFASIAFGLAIATVAVAALTTRNKTEEARGLLYGSYLAGYAFLLLAGTQSAPPMAIELTVLCAYLAVTVLSARARSEKNIWGFASTLGGLLIIRLANTLLTVPSLGMDSFVASIIGASAVAVATGLVARKRGMCDLAIVSTLFILIVGCIYGMSIFDHTLPFAQDVVAVCAMATSLVIASIAARATLKEKDEIAYVGAGLFWIVASRLGFLLLTEAGMRANAALSVTWTLVGISLLAVGFMANVRQLRYMSFLVFASTVCKVLLVDLVALDPAIRVVILLLLGLVMLGGGYWYIRVQRPESVT